MLNQDEELVEHKELASYLFKESQAQATIARVHGKKACRYSPLILLFCIHLKAKLGADSYDFVAK
eukprot:6778736-Ditylum_brightwellii.AAC.1